MPTKPKREEWFQWRIWTRAEEDGTELLMVPHADPMEHEFPFDFQFASAADAYADLDTWGGRTDAEKERWVLCRVTVDPVERFDAAKASPGEDDEDDEDE